MMHQLRHSQKFLKEWSPALLSLPKESSRDLKNRVVNSARHPSCHGYHQPSVMLLLPLSPETALLFILTHAGKEDFSPHLPKTSPQNTKGIWGLRAGRAHCAPFLLFSHWFLSDSFVHKASCIFINMRVCANMFVHLKSVFIPMLLTLVWRKGTKKQINQLKYLLQKWSLVTLRL